MNQFQALLAKLEGPPRSSFAAAEARANQSRSEESEDATQKAANKIARLVLHRDLDSRTKRKAGPVVHFLFGAAAGALYGTLAEKSKIVRRGAGTGYGVGLWLVADEAAVPIAGLSDNPLNYPAAAHVKALASHLVYGATTEYVRRLTRALM